MKLLLGNIAMGRMQVIGATIWQGRVLTIKKATNQVLLADMALLLSDMNKGHFLPVPLGHSLCREGSWLEWCIDIRPTDICPTDICSTGNIRSTGTFFQLNICSNGNLSHLEFVLQTLEIR